MRRLRPRPPSASIAIAAVALFAVLAGTALAQSLITGRDIKDGSITGRDIKSNSIPGKDIRNRTLTGRDVKPNSLTGRQVRESTLGEVPAAADANALGGDPPAAYQRANRWALVHGRAAGATILAQSGGFAVQRTGTGVYNVDTGASAVNRPLTATISVDSPSGTIAAAPCGGSANNPGGVNCAGVNDSSHVLVRTTNLNGVAVDRTFYLVVGG